MNMYIFNARFIDSLEKHPRLKQHIQHSQFSSNTQIRRDCVDSTKFNIGLGVLAKHLDRQSVFRAYICNHEPQIKNYDKFLSKRL